MSLCLFLCHSSLTPKEEKTNKPQHSLQQGTKLNCVMSYTMIRTVVSNLSVASHSPFETSWSCSIYTFYGNIDHPVINTWSLMKNWWQFDTFKVIFRLTNARSVLMIQGNHLKCRFSYQNLSLLNIYDIMCLCWRNLPYHISVKTLIAFFFFYWDINEQLQLC